MELKIGKHNIKFDDQRDHLCWGNKRSSFITAEYMHDIAIELHVFKEDGKWDLKIEIVGPGPELKIVFTNNVRYAHDVDIDLMFNDFQADTQNEIDYFMKYKFCLICLKNKRPE